MKNSLFLPNFLIFLLSAVCIIQVSFLINTNYIYAKSFAKTKKTLSIVEKQLVNDGFNKAYITKLYKRKNVYFDPLGVSLFFRHNETKLNYDQFKSKKSIKKARQYMISHKNVLNSAEKEFGVDKTVITAIILVETRFGTYTGDRLIINTLSSMASLADPETRNILWEKYSDSSKNSKKKFDKWSEKKSKWAYSELKGLLVFAKRENVDPANIIGSYAGAMGICQFMPTNAVHLSKDGNNDGIIDLFTHDDAIYSIANYLKKSGWYTNIDKKKAFKVIYSYNHSSYYVNIILDISEILQK